MAAVHFWYDFSSPWTYLAATQVERVVTGAGGHVVWQPMLLGAVFKQVGTPNVPLLSMSDAKRRWIAKDLYDWAAHWNVPFEFASRFPMRSVTALRLALLAPPEILPALSLDLFRTLWVDDDDLNDEGVLSKILAVHGMDPAASLARTKDPEIKQRLVDQTSRAVELGVFGAPTFIVEHPDGDMLFWGQDRLDFVAKAVTGWRPKHG